MSASDEHRAKTMRRCFALINELGLELTQTERRILEQHGGTAPGYGYDVDTGHADRHNWEIERLT